jgi:hypothetical protein
MSNAFKIMTFFFLLNINVTVSAVEVVNKIKKESKSVLKTFTRKTLKKDEILDFLSKNFIIIDNQRGDGLVTYYFEDIIYKRYKDLQIISEDT